MSQAPDRTAALRRYFEGLAAGTTGGIERAQVVAAPDSPAAVFADHQVGMIAGSRSDPGTGEWSTSVSATNDSVIWQTVGPQQVGDSSDFSGFVFDTADRLVTWQVKPGVMLDDAVGRVDRTVSGDGVTVRVTTAYRTSGGDLQIAFRASGKDGTAQPKAYIRGHRARAGTDQPYQLEVGFGGSSFGWTVIGNAGWGGRQVFQIYYPTTSTTSVPIRQRAWG